MLLIYFVLSTTVLFIGGGIIWSKSNAPNAFIKLWLVVHALLGAYIIFTNNLLG